MDEKRWKESDIHDGLIVTNKAGVQYAVAEVAAGLYQIRRGVHRDPVYRSKKQIAEWLNTLGYLPTPNGFTEQREAQALRDRMDWTNEEPQ